MHIVDTIFFWARTIPRHPAIIEPAGTLTYSGLAHAIEAAAEHFARTIGEPAKPVAVSFNTGSKLLVALFGLLRGGFSVILADKSVFGHLSSVGANTLVFERDTAALEDGTNIPFNDNWLSFGTASEKNTRAIPHTKTGEADILCFTSGTTGRPKLVVCPQNSWQQRALLPLNGIFANYERILIVPSLATSWGLSRAYEALHAGRTVCLAPPGGPALWMLNTHEVDTLLASPQQALELAELQEKSTRYPLTALKSLHLGASTINRASVVRFQKALCRQVIIFYGSTEAGVAALAPYDMIGDVPNAVGYVMPGVDIEIVDGSDRILPIGKEGLVRVRSRVLSENMSAKRSQDSWFYTGDLGWLTETNMLCIAGRHGDVVNRGGEKLSITDIENFLLTCFGVKDAGLCAVMGHAGFSEVWVGLVLAPSADMAALRYTIESNERYKSNIDKIFLVEAIPRGTLGKIQREELKKQLLEIAEEPDAPS